MDIGSLLRIGAALIISLGSVHSSVSIQDNPDRQVIDLFWYQAPDRPLSFVLFLNPAAYLRMTQHSSLPWQEAIQSDYAHVQLADWIDQLMGDLARACPDRLTEITAYSLTQGSFAFSGICHHGTKELRL